MRRLLAILLAAFTLVSLLSIFMLSTSAEDAKTEVYFRLVWHTKVPKWAVVSANAYRFEDEACTIYSGEMLSFRIKRANQWETSVPLTPGYWVVTDIQPVNEWQELIINNSPVFYVSGDVMTVYLGLAAEGKSYTLPDPWVVQGLDNRKFWIWNTTNEDPNSEEDPATTDATDYYSELFGEKTPAENEGLVPVQTPVIEIPSTTNDDADKDAKDTTASRDTDTNKSSQSANIGTIIVFVVLGTIIVVCLVALLVIRYRKRSS